MSCVSKMKPVNIKVFSKEDIKVTGDKAVMNVLYRVKLERNWYERNSSDGEYIDLNNMKQLISVVNLCKKKYKKYKIIDEENLLGGLLKWKEK